MPSSATQRSPYSETTRSIEVSVIPEPLEQQSRVEGGVYAFAYTVTIRNRSSERVQLLERHWRVFSNDQKVADIVGPGVVGVQPNLAPGESFEYTSSAVIHHPTGSMEGEYTLRNEAGDLFKVRIPRFDLLYLPVFH